MGTRPRNAPIVDPVNRCQSPTSTASPNPVNVEIPRRQQTRSTTAVNLAVGGHRGDRGIEAVTAVGGQQHRLHRRVVGHLQTGRVEPVAAQPFQVLTSPRRPAVVDDALAQQQLRHPVPVTHQITAGVLPCPHQIPGRLLLDRGHRDRGDLAQTQQPRQMQRIPGVGLHPIPEALTSFDGAATTHSIPTEDRNRDSPNPVGPPRTPPAAALQVEQPAVNLAVLRAQPCPGQLPSFAVDGARHHRPGMHIKPTLVRSDIAGASCQLWLYRTRQSLPSNPRTLASEASALTPIPSKETSKHRLKDTPTSPHQRWPGIDMHPNAGETFHEGPR